MLGGVTATHTNRSTSSEEYDEKSKKKLFNLSSCLTFLVGVPFNLFSSRVNFSSACLFQWERIFCCCWNWKWWKKMGKSLRRSTLFAGVFLKVEKRMLLERLEFFFRLYFKALCMSSFFDFFWQLFLSSGFFFFFLFSLNSLTHTAPLVRKWRFSEFRIFSMQRST